MVDEEALRPIREMLEHVRERFDYALGQLRSIERQRSLRWRCANCGHVKTFTRPMPAKVAPRCPKCHGEKFKAF
jgi:rubrerythrin